MGVSGLPAVLCVAQVGAGAKPVSCRGVRMVAGVRCGAWPPAVQTSWGSVQDRPAVALGGSPAVDWAGRRLAPGRHGDGTRRGEACGRAGPERVLWTQRSLPSPRLRL